MKNIRSKAKIIAILAVSFVVFATTLFALAENKNGNSLFLDSDQDGLTDQEEKMIGTDPASPDTDGDGYSDGKEVGSGYDPLKAAPGDKLAASAQNSTPADAASTNGLSASSSADLNQLGQSDLLGIDAIADLSSDPNNPNLTNEMIGQLMQLTVDKAETDTSFAENPTYSADDLTQISQNALQTVDITKDLPDIQDSEIDILPAVDGSPRSGSGGAGKKLDEDEVKEEEKKQIEKYLAQIAFVFASNSPFSVSSASELESNLNSESANLISALSTGNTSAIETYSTKARTGIDQMKSVPVPYVLRDIHKSMLALAIYTLELKDEISLDAADPMKSLAAVSSLQAVAQNAAGVQEQLSQILSEYGIDFVNFPA